MRFASLCSGIGGIDLVCQAFGWDLAWHAEIDPDAARVHTARFGDTPNVGDIKTADWATVEPIDVLTAGYPCQPFSTAGRRKAQDDPRHLWPAVRDAVAHLRPSVVLLENVAGHVSLGLGQVLRDLAALGFDAEWGVLGSADIGGCHRRNRVWIAATNPRGARRWQGTGTAPRDEGAHGEPVHDHAADSARESGLAATEPRHVALLPTPAAADGTGGRRAKNLTWEGGTAYRPSGAKAQVSLQEAVDLLPTPTAWLGRRPSHGDCDPDRWNDPARSRELSDFVAAEYRLLPTPTASQGRNATSGRQPDAEFNTGTTLQDVAYAGTFGRYQAVVDRWAAIHGPAPAPTDNRGRLNPQFPEWMLGYPAGWVTDPDLGLSRTAQLRALGNSVQPQTGHAAYRELLARASAHLAVAS